jgi:hypothetical protein
VGLKYFTGAALFWPLAVQILPLLSNIAKLRWQIVAGEFHSLTLTIGRLPTIWTFRRANAQYSRAKPGQLFFLQPEYHKDK